MASEGSGTQSSAAPSQEAPSSSGGPPLWFYVDAKGAQAGPVSVEQLYSLVSSKTITTANFAWRQGLPNWVPMHSIPDLARTGLFKVCLW